MRTRLLVILTMLVVLSGGAHAASADGEAESRVEDETTAEVDSVRAAEPAAGPADAADPAPPEVPVDPEPPAAEPETPPAPATLATPVAPVAPVADAAAAGTSDDSTNEASSEPSVEDQLSRALKLLTKQQEQLDAQQKAYDAQNLLLTQQVQRIDRLEAKIDDIEGKSTLISSDVETVGAPAAEGARGAAGATEDAAATDPAATPPAVATQRDDATKAAVSAALQDDPDDAQEVKEVVAETKAGTDAQEDDPTRAILESLPGAMRLPGTDAVMRWGGFVKSTLVKSFDPLATTDRFITGAIPVTSTTGIEEETEITVSQSRLNMDLREPTKVGLVRAFVEGDFDGSGDTFRLRHAFGQRGGILMGKTWSGFVDRTASPEELDFEGLNGRINVRQAQIRIQPRIGRKYEFMLSLEDPDPDVTFGSGVSQVPDLVASGRINWRDDVHARIAVLLRQVRAQPDSNPDDTVTEFGYGVQLSGRVETPWLDPRDNFLFQLNVGRGIGRYVNDLNSVGDFDGIFTPDGDLELIDVIAGYVGIQHWWRGSMRSNVTFGFVELDNPDVATILDDSLYKRTYRLSGNLMWSPTPRINLGAELLWGMRENENGEDGNATQFQFGAKYLF